MTKNAGKIFLFLYLFIFLLTCFCVHALNLKFNGFISDNASVISIHNQNKLNNILLDLKNKTGVDIGIVTLNSLNNKPIEEVSIDIAREYGLGDKNLNNGALILVAPKEKEARIETGYGLEGIITDAHAGRIIDENMIPYFKNGQYQKGITEGTLALVSDIANSYKVTLEGQPLQTQSEKHNAQSLLLLLLIWLIFLPFFGPFWPLLFLWGGKGTGFGGFGGGSFGGGGANRKW